MFLLQCITFELFHKLLIHSGPLPLQVVDRQLNIILKTNNDDFPVVNVTMSTVTRTIYGQITEGTERDLEGKEKKEKERKGKEGRKERKDARKGRKERKGREGMNEGRKGRKEGRKEGRNEGRKEGMKEGRIEGRKEGMKEGRKVCMYVFAAFNWQHLIAPDSRSTRHTVTTAPITIRTRS